MFSFRGINSYNNQTENINDNNILNNNIIFYTKKKITPIYIKTNKNITNVIENKKILPKLKWGEPIWNLFHVMAEKILPNDFLNIRSDIFDIIRKICYNLPCPECSNHSRNYINSVNFNLILTQKDLKELFYNFHNSVNKRKEYELFDRKELDNKYRNMNLNNVISIFMKTFRNKHNSLRMMSDDFYRNKLADDIQKWFIKNIHHFII